MSGRCFWLLQGFAGRFAAALQFVLGPQRCGSPFTELAK